MYPFRYWPATISGRLRNTLNSSPASGKRALTPTMLPPRTGEAVPLPVLAGAHLRQVQEHVELVTGVGKAGAYPHHAHALHVGGGEYGDRAGRGAGPPAPPPAPPPPPPP